MTDKLWLLPFGPDQIHLPTLHSPDSEDFLIPPTHNGKSFSPNELRNAFIAFAVHLRIDHGEQGCHVWLVYA